jgi:hypothetical protein
MHAGDALEDDFVLDDLVALSGEEELAGGSPDEDEGSLSAEGEGVEPAASALDDASASAKKRKRREKEKEKKAKVSCCESLSPAGVCRLTARVSPSPRRRDECRSPSLNSFSRLHCKLRVCLCFAHPFMRDAGGRSHHCNSPTTWSADN